MLCAKPGNTCQSKIANGLGCSCSQAGFVLRPLHFCLLRSPAGEGQMSNVSHLRDLHWPGRSSNTPSWFFFASAILPPATLAALCLPSPFQSRSRVTIRRPKCNLSNHTEVSNVGDVGLDCGWSVPAWPGCIRHSHAGIHFLRTI
jgi:hypothetical protein